MRDHRREAAIFRHTVPYACHRLPVRRAQVEIARVRRDSERLLREFVVVQIHLFRPPASARSLAPAFSVSRRLPAEYGMMGQATPRQTPPLRLQEAQKSAPRAQPAWG